MSKKAEKGILIGYDDDEGYRVWSTERHRLIRSRDVIFDETPLNQVPDSPVNKASKTEDIEEEEDLVNFRNVRLEGRDNLGENSDLNFKIETPDSPVTIQQEDLDDVHLEADQESEEENLEEPIGRQLRDRSASVSKKPRISPTDETY